MTQQNFSLNIDDNIYKAVLDRIQSENTSLENVLVELITAYSQEEAKITTYTVQRGDSLATIARNVYGDPYQYPLIQQANNITNPGRIWVGQTLIIPPLPKTEPEPTPEVPTPLAPTPSPEAPTPSPKPPPTETSVDPCQAISGESYGTIPIVGPPTDRPAAEHGDINLALRSYQETQAVTGLIDMSGPTDSRAPQLPGLFADNRTGVIKRVYQVNHWNWGTNSKGGAITDFQVTLAGFEIKKGETVHVPKAGYDIGQGYQVMVLYADQERITLKYTGEDTIATGYAIHIEGICTEPSLLTLYKQMNENRRSRLPALRAGQAVGRAITDEIRVAIRDTGRFMDPRTRKDWWRGR